MKVIVPCEGKNYEVEWTDEDTRYFLSLDQLSQMGVLFPHATAKKHNQWLVWKGHKSNTTFIEKPTKEQLIEIWKFRKGIPSPIGEKLMEVLT